jgi:hypothetical protein
MTDDEILAAIVEREGGFVNHPADRGGPTNHGITQTTLAQWRTRDVTIGEVQALSVDEAKAIYRALYLAPFDGLDAVLKPQVVDIAVNSGVKRARTLLVKAQQQTARPVSVQLVVERMEFYAAIVQNNPSQAVFFKGWIRRALSFLVLLLLAGCAGKHPVQLTPSSWRMPSRYSAFGCVPAENLPIDGVRVVVLTCDDGQRLVNMRTGEQTEFVSWREGR